MIFTRNLFFFFLMCLRKKKVLTNRVVESHKERRGKREKKGIEEMHVNKRNRMKIYKKSNENL